MSIKITELYKQIYHRFDNLTPIPFDCGEICGKLCCQGDDESGMYLFPGEEFLFSGNDNFTVLPSEFISGGKSVRLLICKGPCKREERPLSCRIFPLVPYYRNGNLQIIPDPRASICPLTHPEAVGCIDPHFKKELSYAFQVLSKVPEIRNFLEDLSGLLDDFRL